MIVAKGTTHVDSTRIANDPGVREAVSARIGQLERKLEILRNSAQELLDVIDMTPLKDDGNLFREHRAVSAIRDALLETRKQVPSPVQAGVAERIRTIITSLFGGCAEDLDDGARFVEGMRLDEIDLAELALALDIEFDTSICSSADQIHAETVGELIQAIQRRLS